MVFFNEKFNYDRILYFKSWNRRIRVQREYSQCLGGVPQDVLDQYGLSYDKDWLDKCVDQSKRNETAKWDEKGNLIS